MRKMMLTSMGFTTPELSEEFLKLLPKPPAELVLAYIGTAAEPEPDQSYTLKTKAGFERLGFKEVIDVDLKVPEDLAKLDAADVIFVDGGNTFYLLKWVRQSGFDQKLKELLSNDKVYVGVSAGSIILGTSIENAAVGVSGDKNDVALEDIRGLRQAPFMIAPHMNQKEKFAFDQFARKAALRPIIGITDEQAIVCEGDRYRVVGPGKVMTWNSKLFR